MRATTLGGALVSATAVAQMVGPFVFDFNETHIYNDSWPPHAKFHNAQTMSSGVALSMATLVNQQVADAAGRGEIVTRISRTVALDDAICALTELEHAPTSGGGKLVITVV